MNTGFIFENLLRVAHREDVDIKICDLKANYGLIKGKRIALNNTMDMEKMNYTLAHELAHLFLHKNEGDTINGDRHQEYEEQADYSAKFLIHCLSSIQGVKNNEKE